MQKLLNGAIIFLVGVSLVLLGFYFISKPKEDSNTKGHTQLQTEKKQLFPSIVSTFHFKTIKGETFQIDTKDKKFKIHGFENKLVFLKVFGWDCSYCKKEIPELIKLKKDLGDTFDIIAIEAQQSSHQRSIEEINKYGINYHIILGDEHQDFYSYLKAHYGWSSVIPLTIVVGKQGKVLAFEIGAKSYTLAELMKASLNREEIKK